MEFVCNANFKGQYHKLINLRELHERVPNSKLHKTPYQLVIKDVKGTLMLFASGKFRTMGCIDELEASFLPFVYLQKLSPEPFTHLPALTLQSYTLKYDLGFRVNLKKLSVVEGLSCVYEPELFPALRLKDFKPLSVNIFTTGKVMVCGVRDPEEMRFIIPCLKQLCEPYKIT